VNSARLRRKALPYAFVTPLAVLLALVNFYPILFSLQLSLSVWLMERLLEGPTFAGLINFQRMVGDARLWDSTRFMVFFVVASILLEFVLGTAGALLLNSRLRARGLIRSIVILPIAMAPLVAGLVWRYLLNHDYGLTNFLLGAAGLPSVGWLSTLPWAQLSIVIVEVWQHAPFVAVVLLAGLQAIPDEYYEAARIDGASPWRAFWTITLPLLRPALLVAAVIRTTNAVRMFDLSFTLTGGGPFRSTETFSFLAYMEAFTNFQLPYAAALSWLVFVLNLAITLVFVRVLYTRVEV